MCVRISIIVGIFNFALAIMFLPIMLAATLVQAVIGLLLVSNGLKKPHDDVIWKNPFDVGSALRFSILITIILMISTLVARHYGSEALMSVSAFTGLADVDAITLSLARMQEPLVGVNIAADGILIAALTNTMIKAGLAALAGGTETGWRVSAVNLAALLTAGATYLLVGAKSARDSNGSMALICIFANGIGIRRNLISRWATLEIGPRFRFFHPILRSFPCPASL